MRHLTISILVTLAVLLGSAGNAFALPECPTGFFSILSTWMNCFGTATDADGSKYVGEYKDGKKHGKGTFTFGNKSEWAGDKYVGEFKDGKMHGQGTETFANGNKYVGEFKDGKYHGQGTYTSADGNKYVGEFKDGKYHEQGTHEDACLASPNYTCVVSLALAAAWAIEGGYGFASALAEIAFAQATAGKLKDATETVSLAILVMDELIIQDRKIPSTWAYGLPERAQVLAKIAEAQTMTGNVEEARNNFSLALSWAGETIRASDGVWALSRIAESQVKVGKVKEAMKTIGLAVDWAEFVKASGRPLHFYVSTLSDIASAQISAGRLEDAKKNLSKAQAIAKEIEDDPFWRKKGTSNFYGIALALAKAGNYKEAFAAARMSRGSHYRDKARKLVLEKKILAQAKAESIKEALSTAITSEDICRGSSSGDWKSKSGCYDCRLACVQALAEIAKTLAPMRDEKTLAEQGNADAQYKHYRDKARKLVLEKRF